MTQMTKLHPFYEEAANLIKDASTPSEVAAIRSTLEVLNHRAEAKLRLLARKEKPQYSDEDLKNFLDASGPGLAGYFGQHPEIAYTTRRTVENLIFNIHQHFPKQNYYPRTNTFNPGAMTLDTPGLYFDRWIVTHCSVGWPAANLTCFRTNSEGRVETRHFWWVSDAIKALVQGENLFDQLQVTSWRTYQVRPDYLVEVQRDIELPFGSLDKEAQEGYTDEVCQMLNYIGFNVQREELLLKFLPIPGSKVE